MSSKEEQYDALLRKIEDMRDELLAITSQEHPDNHTTLSKIIKLDDVSPEFKELLVLLHTTAVTNHITARNSNIEVMLKTLELISSIADKLRTNTTTTKKASTLSTINKKIKLLPLPIAIGIGFSIIVIVYNLFPIAAEKTAVFLTNIL